MEVQNFLAGLAGTFGKYIDTVQLLMMTVEYFFSTCLFIYGRTQWRFGSMVWFTLSRSNEGVGGGGGG
jgi:hypothetical protein